MKPKALICIGGSDLQLPGLRWVRERGLCVCLVDRNPCAPGRELADEWAKISGNDVAGIRAFARECALRYHLVGVYASSDFGLPAVAAVSARIGTPAASSEAVALTLNKARALDAWRKAGIRVPQGQIVSSLDGALEAIAELGLPVIMKPVDSSGSQGICSVRRREDLEAAFALAQRFSDTILVEQLVEGHHIDVNGLFLEDQFVPCGTMDRFFCDLPYHYPVWGCQPSFLDEGAEKRVYELVEKAARALGIVAGPVKADVIWTKNGPCILELAPRFHGDVSTSFVTPLATGGSPIKAWMAHLAGVADPLAFLGRKPDCFAGWMAIFPTRPGQLMEVRGAEEARRQEGIHDVLIRVKKGRQLAEPKDNTVVCGFIWAHAQTREALYERLSRARSTIELVIGETPHKEL